MSVANFAVGTIKYGHPFQSLHVPVPVPGGDEIRAIHSSQVVTRLLQFTAGMTGKENGVD